MDFVELLEQLRTHADFCTFSNQAFAREMGVSCRAMEYILTRRCEPQPQTVRRALELYAKRLGPVRVAAMGMEVALPSAPTNAGRSFSLACAGQG